MQHIHRIREIERRASAINLSLLRLCELARVPYATVWRWKGGEVSPLQRTADKHLGALERKLVFRERAISRAIACRERRAG